MKVTLLGTGTPIPDAQRAGPATLVQSADATILVDCGRGVLMRLVAAGVLPFQLSAVLVTHLHSDHLTDLNDVITTQWIMSAVPSPLGVVGPSGIAAVVSATLAALGPDIRYRLAHHAGLTWRPVVETTEIEAGKELQLGTATVRVGATDHRPAEPTVAYRIEAEGKAVVLGGDGVPCSTLEELCIGADAYVQTVLRDDLVRAIPSPRFHDTIDYHSSVEDAARTAGRAGVRTLVLTHYVPGLLPGQEDEWRAIAAREFAGKIVLGNDLTSVEV
jgi:ribonuclease Z